MKPGPKYCISPWVEGVLRINNQLCACCKNPTNLGEWRNDTLSESWKSTSAINLRQHIVDGEFADDYCKVCYNNKTNNRPKKLLDKPLREFCDTLDSEYRNSHPIRAKLLRLFRKPSRTKNLRQLANLFNKQEMDKECLAVFSAFEKELTFHTHSAKSDSSYFMATQKLRVVSQVLYDFLSGNTKPRHIAPFRQTNLIAICNARCIQCHGLFTGELENGLPDDQGNLVKQMDRLDIDDSLSHENSIIDFFNNGSEFLMLKDWKYVAHRLKDMGVMPRISTNGTLLTRSNVDYLLANRLVGRFNISIDGTQKKTIEKIRQRVQYDQLTRNAKYLFKSLEDNQIKMPVTFSFCLMKENYQELPSFVNFVDRLRTGNKTTIPNILIQPLAAKGVPAYLDFVRNQHHSVIEKNSLNSQLKEMLQHSQRLNIPVHVFYTSS